MNKIGDRERLLGETESSFSPCDYRPTTGRSSHSYDEDPQSPGLERDAIIATATHNLPKSSLFLPCHYFTYAAGTSTGGSVDSLPLSMPVFDGMKPDKYNAVTSSNECGRMLARI